MTTGAITRRPLASTDYDALLDLVRTTWDHDVMGPHNIDRIRDRYVDERPGWVRAVEVWESDRALVALAAVWRRIDDAEGQADGQVEIHPAHRRPDIEDGVIRTLRSSAVELGDRPVTLGIVGRERQTWKAAMLARHGFVVDRAFHRMSRDLTEPIAAPMLPAGYEVRPLADDTEVPAWCDAATEAFAGHYDAPRFEVDQRRRKMLTPEYVEATDLVAVGSDGRITGVAWSFRERMVDGAAGGHVNYVAVLPEHRGRGVARALLLASLHALHDLGLETAVLSVDAGNETNALRLYESAGFVKVDAALVYLVEVA